MAKVLVVRKPDGTIHQIPIANKAKIMGYNNKLSKRDQWQLEEMDEEKAKKLPYIDKSYTPTTNADATIKAKDDKIKELEAKLAALKNNAAPETANDKIARINAATAAEDVTAILGDDDRKTVKEAADKKIASFSAE
jgi:hypothetical protein